MLLVGCIKLYSSGPAAVAIWLSSSAVAHRMSGGIQGGDWSAVSSVLYLALDSEEWGAVCPRKENDEQELD